MEVRLYEQKVISKDDDLVFRLLGSTEHRGKKNLGFCVPHIECGEFENIVHVCLISV